MYVVQVNILHTSFVEVEIGRSVTCDGKFLFITSSSGRGLVKVGTGLHGTLR